MLSLNKVLKCANTSYLFIISYLYLFCINAGKPAATGFFYLFIYFAKYNCVLPSFRITEFRQNLTEDKCMRLKLESETQTTFAAQDQGLQVY